MTGQLRGSFRNCVRRLYACQHIDKPFTINQDVNRPVLVPSIRIVDNDKFEMVHSATLFARTTSFRLQRLHVPLRFIEGAAGFGVGRVPADFLFGMDDLAGAVDGVLDDAGVDGIAVPGA